ncbi:MAG: transposase [Clostridia bacterium]|nr:transposase [Clostridia bacterium]
MKYDPKKHHRRSIRLKGYDYSRPGWYFITINCKNRARLFGEVKDKKMILNDAGRMVELQWLALKDRYWNIALHEFQVMPDHFHSILEITAVATVGKAVATVGETAVGATAVAATLVVAPDQATTRVAPTASAQPTPPKKITVGAIIGAFKSIVTVEYIHGVKQRGWLRFRGKLLQRNYFDRILRGEKSRQRVAKYIIDNPKNWRRM